MTAEFVSQLQSLHTDAFGWALHCCAGDFHTAEEVLQLAYVKLVQGRLSFAGDSTLKTWWFGVVRFTALEEIRRQKFRRSVLGRLLLLEGTQATTSATSLLDSLERDESALHLIGLMRKLPARQAEVLHLVFYQDLSIAQAAVIMKVSLGSARTHYDRAKAALRQLIQQQEEDVSHEPER
jgi:RNA polymerase sigma-70 factor (ECF subfamily)